MCRVWYQPPTSGSVIVHISITRLLHAWKQTQTQKTHNYHLHIKFLNLPWCHSIAGMAKLDKISISAQILPLVTGMLRRSTIYFHGTFHWGGKVQRNQQHASHPWKARKIAAPELQCIQLHHLLGSKECTEMCTYNIMEKTLTSSVYRVTSQHSGNIGISKTKLQYVHLMAWWHKMVYQMSRLDINIPRET